MLSEKIFAFLDVFKSFQEGSVSLPYGQSEFIVKTRETPREVWVSFADNGVMPVCMGDVNTVGYTIHQDGFVLYSNITSDSAQINYCVIFDDKAF